MSEELQSMIQIIELYGRGLEALGRAIRFSAKGYTDGMHIEQLSEIQERIQDDNYIPRPQAQ